MSEPTDAVQAFSENFDGTAGSARPTTIAAPVNEVGSWTPGANDDTIQTSNFASGAYRFEGEFAATNGRRRLHIASTTDLTNAYAMQAEIDFERTHVQMYPHVCIRLDTGSATGTYFWAGVILTANRTNQHRLRIGSYNNGTISVAPNREQGNNYGRLATVTNQFRLSVRILGLKSPGVFGPVLVGKIYDLGLNDDPGWGGAEGNQLRRIFSMATPGNLANRGTAGFMRHDGVVMAAPNNILDVENFNVETFDYDIEQDSD